MEKVYYPSVKKYYRHLLIAPLGAQIGVLAANVYLNFTDPPANWQIIYFLLLTQPIVFLGSCMLLGFRGEKLAIRVKPDSIYGRMVMGRDMLIPFDKINFEKTRKRKQVCNVDGDYLNFNESIFEPEDAAKIWKAIDGFEKKAKSKQPKQPRTRSIKSSGKRKTTNRV